MEAIKDEDYVLYNGVVGKVELILGDVVVANIEGVKVKDKISNFKKWDKDKIHNISKEQFIMAMGKVLDKSYLSDKYPNLDDSELDMILTSGALVIRDLQEELFRGNYAKNGVDM